MRWAGPALTLIAVAACAEAPAPPPLEPPPARPPEQVVRLAGASSATPLVARLAAVFQTRTPGTPLVVEAPIDRADEALAEGLVDAALGIGAPPPGAVVLARTRPVMAVGAGVAARTLTVEQVRDMARGAVRAWPSGLPVRFVLRSADDPLMQALAEVAPAWAAPLQAAARVGGAEVLARDAQVLEALRRSPGTVGLVDSGNLQLSASPLWLAQVAEVDVRVPLWVRPGASASPRLRAFLAFVQSEEARSLAADFGFEVP
ncbi:MAG: hypothetical protein H6704_22070 [Myxococcales bacterium]|nr:hypothetical protein [Myxococcales bacterium]